MNPFERHRLKVRPARRLIHTHLVEQSESPAKNFRDWATLLLVVCTTVGVFWQVHEMIKVYGPIKDQAEATRESFVAVQRPFVTAKQLNASGSNMPANQLYEVILENTGSTPTKNLEVHVSFSFNLEEINSPPSDNRNRPLFAPTDPEPTLLAKAHEWPPANLVIAPKGIARLPIGGPTISHLREMAKRRADGYVFGVAYYNDFFSGSKRHMTKFCFVVQPVLAQEQLQTGYGLCQHWNCADDECAIDKQRYEQKHGFRQ